MAIYHLHGKILSRSGGYSAVASAAYRAGEVLYDERMKETHDYNRKGGVLHCEILAPDNAKEWTLEREKLWNEVEATEKRKDSQLAREIEVALPRELSEEKHIKLVKEFCQENFVDKGMIADIAIHEGVAGDGGKNPHAHIMLTMRDLTEDGSCFEKKNLSWNEKKQLEAWRENWANSANKYLTESDKEIKLIDHRSYASQGLELQPTQHMGKDAAALERRGIETEIGSSNRVIEHINRAMKLARESLDNVRDYAVEFYHHVIEPAREKKMEQEQEINK